MADGPTIQLAGQRALDGGQTLEKTLRWCVTSAPGNDTTPIVFDGVLQPYLFARGGSVPDRCQGGGRGWPDRGRSAARRRQRTVCARPSGRVELHPACHADDGRRAFAEGSAKHVGASYITSQSPESPGPLPRKPQTLRQTSRASKPQQTCRLLWDSAFQRPTQLRKSLALPMAVWSGLPSSSKLQTGNH